jgi:PAS domain S-box-containing protein
MAVALRVLLIEDSENDAMLLVRQLRGAGYDVVSERVDTLEAMRAALERQPWDLLISDYNMPSFSGTAALALHQERGLDVPFIFVSGTIGEDVAVAAMRAGASDYVMKGKPQRLVPAIQRELRDAANRRERRRAQDIVVERTRLAELSADIGIALTGVASLPDALGRCATAVIRHLDAICACIWTINDTRDTLELQAGVGLPSGGANGYARVAIDQPPIGAIVRHGQPFFSRSPSDLGMADRAWAEHVGIGALAAVPLLVERRVVGVLAVFSREPLVAFVRDALGAMADQLAVGIERRRAADELRQAEERFSKVFRLSPVAIAISTLDEDRYVDANDAFLALIDARREEVVGRTAHELGVWADPAQWAGVMDGLRRDGTASNVELATRTKQGVLGSVLASFERIELGGRPCLLSLVHDMSARKQLEEQLRQAQKMEAVGRLAGGVAHDFNNLLSVITGYCDLLLRPMAPEAQGRVQIEEMRGAAEAATSVTRQLLAFSRRQVNEPRVLDLSGVVGKTERMLQRLLGSDIALVTRLASGAAAVHADPGQIEQVVMNLAVNARDAMPTGGRLVIETAVVELDETAVRDDPTVRPGCYVMLAVRDTGVGMDPQTQARIFEPFFTTKDVGKGTGLGLATVYGIVRQSGGLIRVESEPGQGTTFRVYLPQVDEAAAAVEAGTVAPRPAGAPRGSEVVLVVEDSDPLRAFGREVLELQGYTVLDAPNGLAALEMAVSHEERIDLLVSDVVLPGMNGRELAGRLTSQRPLLKVLFTSGHPAEVLERYGIEAGDSYLQKPFTLDSLARKVREVLDGPKS